MKHGSRVWETYVMYAASLVTRRGLRFDIADRNLYQEGEGRQ